MKNNANLLARIKQALANDPTLAPGLPGINIAVNDGTVVLSGTIDSTELKTRATEIVSAIPGVDYLIEEFRIDKGDQHRVDVTLDWENGKMTL